MRSHLPDRPGYASTPVTESREPRSALGDRKEKVLGSIVWVIAREKVFRLFPPRREEVASSGANPTDIVSNSKRVLNAFVLHFGDRIELYL